MQEESISPASLLGLKLIDLAKILQHQHDDDPGDIHPYYKVTEDEGEGGTTSSYTQSGNRIIPGGNNTSTSAATAATEGETTMSTIFAQLAAMGRELNTTIDNISPPYQHDTVSLDPTEASRPTLKELLDDAANLETENDDSSNTATRDMDESSCGSIDSEYEQYYLSRQVPVESWASSNSPFHTNRYSPTDLDVARRRMGHLAGTLQGPHGFPLDQDQVIDHSGSQSIGYSPNMRISPLLTQSYSPLYGPQIHYNTGPMPCGYRQPPITVDIPSGYRPLPVYSNPSTGPTRFTSGAQPQTWNPPYTQRPLYVGRNNMAPYAVHGAPSQNQ
ncbi:uncharacterized protein IL334_004713 [Kwoniella shivajii]|uniref:Uncharacterized protein n=1 Tax=Kwoniella shivajii TaxID=564305 RepID=A0ABZ1D1H8_9TREE|nr:hypothetical protein IL334_004713 [Kwoniella shivajii]